MFSVIRKVFYDLPRKALQKLWKNRHNRLNLDDQTSRENATHFIEREIFKLGHEIDCIDDVLERQIIPSLLEYKMQSGTLDNDEVKYLSKRTTIAETESRIYVHSQILSDLRHYEKKVPTDTMKEYFQTWRIYQDKILSLKEKHEDMSIE